MSEWPNEWPWKPTKHYRWFVPKGGSQRLQQLWKQPEWKGKKTWNYEWRDLPVKGAGDE
jgi:hypothetical protein